MKTLKELFYEHHMEVGSAVSRELQKVCVEYIEGILEDCVNVDTLPEVIKQQANAFQQTHCSCEPSVAMARQFASWFKENTPKEGLSKATTFTKQFVKDAWDNGYSAGYDKANKWHSVFLAEPEVEDDWVVPDKEPL